MKPKLLKLISKNHNNATRDYFARMNKKKINCVRIAKKYSFQYWDGDRKYGYGGYKYDGRWKKIALQLINKYSLTKKSKILDIGCGKSHLIYEITRILKSNNIHGLDISKYAIKNSPREIKKNLKLFDARKNLNYPKNYFDLIISINLIHNFKIFEISNFLKNILKISKKSYIAMESYRSDQELINLQCWALTAQSFFSDIEWEWILKKNKYFRDYELIFFD